MEKLASVVWAKQKMKGYIYGIIDENGGGIRYIGQTRGSLKSRLQEHIAHPTNFELRCWIQDIRARGFDPQIIRLEIVPDGGNLDKQEKYWIDTFAKRGHRLFNRTCNPRREKHELVPVYALISRQVFDDLCDRCTATGENISDVLRQGFEANENMDWVSNW